MRQESLKRFLDKQVDEMNRDKWDEGKKIGRDPGQEYLVAWISKYSVSFRKKFALSDIKTALKELDTIRKRIEESMKVASEIQTRLIESIELLETEPETNGTLKS